MGTFLLVLLMLVSAFLMFVVLIQRGRGGGLAGAFGGAGGQSAFGTKAGDMFTWITVWAGIAWVILAILAGWALRVENAGSFTGGTGPAAAAAAPGGKEKDKKEDADEPAPGDDVPKTTGKKSALPKSDEKAPTSDKAADAKSGAPAKSTETSPPAKTEAPKGDAPKADAGKTTTPPAKTESKK